VELKGITCKTESWNAMEAPSALPMLSSVLSSFQAVVELQYTLLVPPPPPPPPVQPVLDVPAGDKLALLAGKGRCVDLGTATHSTARQQRGSAGHMRM